MNVPLYILFFCSGISGLIYQVVWIREFGNVFGNTVYSAALVIAVFMLGLGVGSYLIGAWADRRYADRPDSLLKAYGGVEALIACLGLAISLFLPQLGSISAAASSYSRDGSGWYVLSTASYVARGAIATILLTPITLLMGGTLTLLVRHLVRKNVGLAGSRIATLYGLNTAGAAFGCFMTDFALVPAVGLQGTQVIAAVLNAAVAAGALFLAGRTGSPIVEPHAHETPKAAAKRRGKRQQTEPDRTEAPESNDALAALTGAALALSGFGALGMEIVWFRHFTLLLGGFRAVFSMLLTVILIGIGAGSLLGGLLHRRTARPAQWLMAIQGLFVAATLLGLTTTDVPTIVATANALAPGSSAPSGLLGALLELRLNAVPMLFEVGLPALLMGFTFPLANAVIQRAELSVGRRAGLLYFANTAGAVCGSLAAGFLLLPNLGIQASATVLTAISGLAMVPLYAGMRLGAPRERPAGYRGAAVFTLSAVVAGIALAVWLSQPSTYLIARTQMILAPGERILTVSEGVNEVIAIADVPDEGRQLLTNGHPMSSTNPMSQRYMRALAHIPLLSIEHPADSVLVIGFGVGETLHAITLHPAVKRVDLADLSTGVLDHAVYFHDTNKDVIKNPRVTVYVNDGRQHLRMQPEATYDVIALEPPPITHAGVGALYSTEFYQLARTRLKPGGYISQWLPAYQMPPDITLAMVRAFLDAFPQAVLLSGADAELLLIGANGPRIEIDPARLVSRLADTPAVQADLARLNMGTVRELVGTFVGGPDTLDDATRGVPPVTDDRRLQEYGVRSLLTAVRNGVPASLFDLNQVAGWCPACFIGKTPAPVAEGLDTYLSLVGASYKQGPAGIPGLPDALARRMIQDSPYLQRVLPLAHLLLGLALASEGRLGEAVTEYRKEIELEPRSGAAHLSLGRALVAMGSIDAGIAELQIAAQIEPNDPQTLDALATALLDAKQYDAAVNVLSVEARLLPASSEVRNKLNMALEAQRRAGTAR